MKATPSPDSESPRTAKKAQKAPRKRKPEPEPEPEPEREAAQVQNDPEEEAEDPGWKQLRRAGWVRKMMI